MNRRKLVASLVIPFLVAGSSALAEPLPRRLKRKAFLRRTCGRSSKPRT
jgi:hypothetical protein